MKRLSTYAAEMGLPGAVLVALVGILVALTVAAYLWNPIQTVENEFVEPVAERIGVSSPASEYQCPANWRETRGYEPESGLNFVSCSDGRYIVTKRDGAEPVAFDGERGVFVDAGQIK